MDIGSLRHRVTLENPTLTTDGDGGYTEAWSLLSPAVVNASIEPATASRIERLMAGTVDASTTHIVVMRYHASVSVATRITFAGRALHVVGIQNPFERNEVLYLACVERVAP